MVKSSFGFRPLTFCLLELLFPQLSVLGDVVCITPLKIAHLFCYDVEIMFAETSIKISEGFVFLGAGSGMN